MTSVAGAAVGRGEEGAEAVVSAEVAELKGWLARRVGAPPQPAARDFVSPTLGLMKGIPLPPVSGFTMGCKPGRDDVEGKCDSNKSSVAVTLTKGFWLMEKEVTQGQWKAVMGENPVASECPSVGVGDDLPVVCVSWEDVQSFIRKVSTRDQQSYRLPTEAEWEWSARGGQELAWSGIGTASELPSSANIEGQADGYEYLAPVGSYRGNGYGLYDMTGNVWEWVEDAYESALPGGQNPVRAWGTTSQYRVNRGGSWNDSARSARVAYRFGGGPGYRIVSLGFRLARSVP